MDKKFSFAQRLRELLDYYSIRQADLASRTGISKSSLSHYLKGDWEGKQDVIYKISNAYGVSAAWLMGVDCPMIPDITPESSKKAFDPFTTPGILPLPKTYKVPLLGNIACGKPILAEENVDTYIPVPDDIRCDFSLRCKGDSMIGARIKDGDIVYIRQQPDVENGEIAAVLIDDVETEATLKRIYKGEDQITLMPANENYSPLVYVGENMNRVRIIGKAVAFVSAVR